MRIPSSQQGREVETPTKPISNEHEHPIRRLLPLSGTTFNVRTASRSDLVDRVIELEGQLDRLALVVDIHASRLANLEASRDDERLTMMGVRRIVKVERRLAVVEGRQVEQIARQLAERDSDG